MAPSRRRATTRPATSWTVARGQRSLAALAGYREDAVTVATPGNDPVRITGAIVTAGYFDVFGMRALHGRSFSASADAATNEPLVVLSEELWRQHFSASHRRSASAPA